MKYYYITEGSTHYEVLGSSILGISNNNKHLQYDTNIFWEITKPINLVALAGEGAVKIIFSKYTQSDMYVLLMIPELKMVFEQFNMPTHKWYQADARYDLKYIHNMKRFHKIEFGININEKRDYWVLQILDKRREELALEEMDFNIVDIRNKKSILRSLDTKISTLEQLYNMSRQVHSNSKKNDIIEFIDSPKYIYHKSYDILWAGTKVVFNDKVKTALEATNIITPENGLQFAEFTDYEIEMLGEDV